MNTNKSIFSRIGRFLEKARRVMLNLSTAFILFFLTIIIIGSLRSLGSEKKDPSGRVLSINPKGTVDDQAVFQYDFLIESWA